MPQFMLLLRRSPTADPGLSPAEIETIIRDYEAWRSELEGAGRLVGSRKLVDDGGKRLVPEDEGVRVLDGPFTEGKEVVGGYFVIEADDYDQAVELSLSCPHLGYGGAIELRRIEVFEESP